MNSRKRDALYISPFLTWFLKGLNEFMNVGRHLHCHAIFAGNMASCLRRFCEVCSFLKLHY